MFTDERECASRPCQNGAPCRDGLGGYVCECRGEFTGRNCDRREWRVCVRPCVGVRVCVRVVGVGVLICLRFVFTLVLVCVRVCVLACVCCTCTWCLSDVQFILSPESAVGQFEPCLQFTSVRRRFPSVTLKTGSPHAAAWSQLRRSMEDSLPLCCPLLWPALCCS